MAKEQRIGIAPVPETLKDVLNESQIHTLKRMENFGWELKFIRRPLFQDVLPVLIHLDSNTFGVLDEDNTLNMHRDLNIREQAFTKAKNHDSICLISITQYQIFRI